MRMERDFGGARKSSKETTALDADPDIIEIRRNWKAGDDLKQDDLKNPARGLVLGKIDRLRNIAVDHLTEGNPELESDIKKVQEDFLQHFGEQEARRYRLYHKLFGSDAHGHFDLFDAEGEWSIEKAMDKLAEKYKIPATDAA